MTAACTCSPYQLRAVGCDCEAGRPHPRYTVRANPHPILRPAFVVWDTRTAAACYGYRQGMSEAAALEAAAVLNRAYYSLFPNGGAVMKMPGLHLLLPDGLPHSDLCELAPGRGLDLENLGGGVGRGHRGPRRLAESRQHRAFAGSDAVELFRAAALKSALGLLSIGIRPTRGMTLTKTLAACERYTGRKIQAHRGRARPRRPDRVDRDDEIGNPGREGVNMGYVFAMSPCIGCGRVFGYNPHTVPSSSAVTGQREPVCRSCMDTLNARRAESGLAPFTIAPDAYEAGPE